MKKGKTALKFIAISMLTLAIASGCSNKKADIKGETTAALETMESKEETTQATKEQKDVKLVLNFDLANFIGSDKEEVVASFGDPAKKDDLDKVSVYTYEDDKKTLSFSFYKQVSEDSDLDNTCFFIKSDLSKLWGLNDEITKQDFIDALNIKDDDILKDDLEGSKEIGERVMAFEYDGYFFAVELDKQDMVSPDSAVGIYTVEIPYAVEKAE